MRTIVQRISKGNGQLSIDKQVFIKTELKYTPCNHRIHERVHRRIYGYINGKAPR